MHFFVWEIFLFERKVVPLHRQKKKKFNLIIFLKEMVDFNAIQEQKKKFWDDGIRESTRKMEKCIWL